MIDPELIERIQTDHLGRALVHHVLDGLQDPLAQIAARVSVPELVCFVLTGRGAGRNGSSACRAPHQFDVDLDRGVAAGVQYLSGAYCDDLGHGFASRSP